MEITATCIMVIWAVFINTGGWDSRIGSVGLGVGVTQFMNMRSLFILLPIYPDSFYDFLKQAEAVG